VLAKGKMFFGGEGGEGGEEEVTVVVFDTKVVDVDEILFVVRFVVDIIFTVVCVCVILVICFNENT
jgi:hypothetical protein